MAREKSVEVAVQQGVVGWNEAMSSVVDVGHYTGGAVLVEDKTVLQGVAFIITSVKLQHGDLMRRVENVMQPSTYVSVTALLREPLEVNGVFEQLVVFNDGGSGIAPVIREHIEATESDDVLLDYDDFRAISLKSMLLCKRGLRLSKYDAKLADGSVIKDAQTWYLA